MFSPAGVEENLISVEVAKELRDHFDDLFRGKFPTGHVCVALNMSWEITEGHVGIVSRHQEMGLYKRSWLVD